jgi:Fe-S cluster biogenesis protein NfuA
MKRELESVVISREPDGSFVALHTPSGKKTVGASMDEANDAMRKLLGMDAEGEFTEPLTSDRFSGVARDIARFLEGPVSDMLKFHSGFARLEAYESGIAHIKLGGGCEGCPSSLITLLNGVRSQLQDEFGEDQVVDVVPVD